MTITPDELRAIRERADAATDLTDVHNTITSESVARTDVPALCDAYESALAEVERLRGALERILRYADDDVTSANRLVHIIGNIAHRALADGGER